MHRQACPPIVQRHKSIRLPANHYIGQRRYFVTAVTAKRVPYFLNGNTARMVIAVLRETAAQHHFAICTYCVMPDHVHFLVAGMDATSNLRAFMIHFKRSCTMLHRASHGRGALWQISFYDHILREDESNSPVARYILLNPVRKNLCATPDEYEFSGSFARDWPDVADATDWDPPWRRS
jgi:putative transposase